MSLFALAFPPMYFPVYNLHIVLIEPSLHAQPILGTPSPHVEGLHSVQWLIPDNDHLTKTVKGDFLRIALRDHDSGKLIPHIPIPLLAGPHLLKTLMKSQYIVVFHQPKVTMDKGGKTTGVFFWGLAPTWHCMEIPLPIPAFLGKMAKAAKAAKMARTAATAAKAAAKIGKIASFLEKAGTVVGTGLEVAGTVMEAAAVVHGLAEGEGGPIYGFLAGGLAGAGASAIGEAAKGGEGAKGEGAKGDGASSGGAAGGSGPTGPTAIAGAAPAGGDAGGGGGAADAPPPNAQQARTDEAAALDQKNKSDAASRQANDQATAADDTARQHLDNRTDSLGACDRHDAKAGQLEQEEKAHREAAKNAATAEEAAAHQRQADAKRAEFDQAVARQKAAYDQAQKEKAAYEQKKAEADALRKQAAEHDAQAKEADQRAKKCRQDAQEAKKRDATGGGAGGEGAGAGGAGGKPGSGGGPGGGGGGTAGGGGGTGATGGKDGPKGSDGGIAPLKAGVAVPCILCHVPFPCTVQIYMSWADLAKNWLNAVISFAKNVLKAYLGFVFDNILANKWGGKLANALVAFGKGLANSVVDAGAKFLIDHKIEIKISQEMGPIKVTATISRDDKTGDWKWKGEVEATKKVKGEEKETELKAKASAEGSLSDPSVDKASVGVSAGTKGEGLGEARETEVKAGEEWNLKDGSSKKTAGIEHKGPANSEAVEIETTEKPAAGGEGPSPPGARAPTESETKVTTKTQSLGTGEDEHEYPLKPGAENPPVDYTKGVPAA